MKSTLLLFICCVLYGSSQAQFNRKHARASEVKPKAVLVQLPTQTNRMDYLMKKNNHKKIAQLKTDRDNVIKKMAADFNDHFEFCTYYFFYDTNTNNIKERKFNGNLLNGNLQPATKLVLSPDDTDYIVVYYGYVADDKNTFKTKRGQIETTKFSNSTHPTLLGMDWHFNLLPDPMPYKPMLPMNKKKQKPQITTRNNGYQSKYFDIQYTPLASSYSRTLARFYNGDEQ